jgi:hypothetical protein
MTTPTPDQAREALDKLAAYAVTGWGEAPAVEVLRRFIDAHSAPPVTDDEAAFCMRRDPMPGWDRNKQAIEKLSQSLDEHFASPPPAPVQPEPTMRPPTPAGWSDTDWLAHLASAPPIAYAVRDHLYGTSKSGVLRFAASDETGAFAVYTSPPPAQPATDPMDTPLPCDVKVGNGTHRKGTSLRTLVNRMQMLHEAAFGPELSQAEKDANLAVLQGAQPPKAEPDDAQRDAQAAEIERQREVIAKVNARCDHLGMRLGEVIRERDALRADAEKYRWLRDATLHEPDSHKRIWVHEFAGPLAYGDNIDSAIDAARAQEQQK